jgi:hypothetical protein
MKTTGANISYVFNINLSMLCVSTISSGHLQALMNIIQVIKLLVIIRIRIPATDGCNVQTYIPWQRSHQLQDYGSVS